MRFPQKRSLEESERTKADEVGKDEQPTQDHKDVHETHEENHLQRKPSLTNEEKVIFFHN
jgi:hypothetical protein